MDVFRIVRRICYPVFLISALTVIGFACSGIWFEVESLWLWKVVGISTVIALTTALVLSATRVTFKSPVGL